MARAESWLDVEVGQVLAQTNNGQGDCLFVALSQQLDGQFTSQQLRNMAVEYLAAHTEEFAPELLSLGWEMMETGEIAIPLEGDILIDAALETLSHAHTWGGAECLAALSLGLNREIRVYQEGGPTLQFPSGDLPGLRIVLRYPRNGNRRTHYESVLHWRLGPPCPSTSNSTLTSVGTQTSAVTQDGPLDPTYLQESCGSLEVPSTTSGSCAQTSMVLQSNSASTLDVPRDPTNLQESCGSSEVPCSTSGSGARSSMVLRSSIGCGPLSPDFLRREEFSEEEEAESEVKNDPDLKRYNICRICGKNTARYALLNCGCFPICGRCIRQWYVRFDNVPCPGCGRLVAGWTRVFNQH